MIELARKAEQTVLKHGLRSSSRDSYSRAAKTIERFADLYELEHDGPVITTSMLTPDQLASAYIQYLLDNKIVAVGSINTYYNGFKFFLAQGGRTLKDGDFEQSTKYSQMSRKASKRFTDYGEKLFSDVFLGKFLEQLWIEAERKDDLLGTLLTFELGADQNIRHTPLLASNDLSVCCYCK